MSNKIRMGLIYILLIVGLILIFGGLLLPEMPVTVQQTSFIDSELQTINTDELLEYEERYNEYEPALPGERENYIIDNYNIDEFSNETQNNLNKLINNETSSIESTELFEGEFIVHFGDNKSYMFDGEQMQSNPLMFSLWGYLLIIIATILFMRIPSNDDKEKDKSTLLDGVKVADEDSEWDYILVDENDKESDKK